MTSNQPHTLAQRRRLETEIAEARILRETVRNADHRRRVSQRAVDICEELSCGSSFIADPVLDQLTRLQHEYPNNVPRRDSFIDFEKFCIIGSTADLKKYRYKTHLLNDITEIPYVRGHRNVSKLALELEEHLDDENDNGPKPKRSKIEPPPLSRRRASPLAMSLSPDWCYPEYAEKTRAEWKAKRDDFEKALLYDLRFPLTRSGTKYLCVGIARAPTLHLVAKMVDEDSYGLGDFSVVGLRYLVAEITKLTQFVTSDLNSFLKIEDDCVLGIGNKSISVFDVNNRKPKFVLTEINLSKIHGLRNSISTYLISLQHRLNKINIV